MVNFIIHSLFIHHRRTLMGLVGTILEAILEWIIAISLTGTAITMESQMTNIPPALVARVISTVIMELN